MSKLVGWSLVLIAIMFVASPSRSEDLGTATEPPPLVDLSVPADVPLGANPPRDPFTPYDVGPPEAVWSYDQLSAADKAVADRGRDVSAMQADLDAYNAAMKLQAARSNADMAARLLGIQGLGDIGVVP